MDSIRKRAISLTLTAAVLSSSAWAITPVMTVTQMPDIPVVGQTVTFIADCDSPVEAYEWIFPSAAYRIIGQTTDRVTCKFDSFGYYAIKLYYRYNGIWYGPEEASVFVAYAEPTWYVSPDGDDNNNGQAGDTAFRTVQTAINSAADGDTIVLAQGTYHEQINVKGRNVTIRSTSPQDPNLVQSTIIDADRRGSVVVFDGSEQNPCKLEGITLRGGAPAGDGLALCLPLDGNLLDTSGKGRTGTLCFTGDPNWAEEALEFDGDDVVEIEGYKGIPGSDERTLCAWVKPVSDGTILSWGSTSGPGQDGGTKCYLHVSGSRLSLNFHGSYVRGSAVIADDAWHHVAAVVPNRENPDVTDVRLYVDGALQTAEVVINALNTNGPMIDTWPEEPVRLGAFSNGSVKDFYQGRMKEVRIYSRGLSEVEIGLLAGLPLQPPDGSDLMAYWPLDETAGTNVEDYSGNDYDGQIVGECSLASGKMEGALNLEASDNYVQSSCPGIQGGGSRTCAAWLKATGAGMIISWGHWSSSDYGHQWSFGLRDNGCLAVGLCGGITYGSLDLRDGRWHHVAAVLADDGSPVADEILLYVDGRREEWGACANPLLAVQTATQTAEEHVICGARYLDMSRDYNFPGLLDDARIYSRALAAEEIWSLYEQGIGLHTGGGLRGYGAGAEIARCIIRNNASAAAGGGLWNLGGTVANCFITGNRSESDGGGVYLQDDVTTFVNCLLADNAASPDSGCGGGLYLRGGWSRLANCTLSNNLAFVAGGIFNDNGTLDADNSILWDNRDEDAVTVNPYEQVLTEPNGITTIDYTCIQGHWPTGTGNINSLPKFTVPGHWEPPQYPDSICLQATVRDFLAGNEPVPPGYSVHPDFECSYDGDGEPGIVGPLGSPIGPDRKPVYALGPNGENPLAHPDSTHGPGYFYQWFNYTEGVNLETQIQLELQNQGSGIYEFRSSEFFPIDDCLFGTGQQRNYHFTLELHTEFDYQARNEYFRIFEADDDLFIYLDGRLIVDIGGIHGAKPRYIELVDGDVHCYASYEAKIGGAIPTVIDMNLVYGNRYTFDLFFAERHTVASHLEFSTSMALQPNLTPGDYRILAGSPCIDAGTNDPNLPLFDTDLGGDARRTDDPNTPDTGWGAAPIVDMGAFEYQPPEWNRAPQVEAGPDRVVAAHTMISLAGALVTDDGLPAGQLDLLWSQVSGPGLVYFQPPGPSDPNTSAVIDPNVYFSAPGLYTLRLEAFDGVLYNEDTVQVTVVAVDAGENQTLRLPLDAVTLTGAVEGLEPGTYGVQWSVTWPSDASVTLTDSQSLQAAASFPASGTCLFELTVTYGGYELSDTVIVTVEEDLADINQAPGVRVWAEPAEVTWPTDRVELRAEVWDDGLPSGGCLTVQWSEQSVPLGGQATFTPYTAQSPHTTARFSRPGAYVLKLTADDGSLQSEGLVQVNVIQVPIPSDNMPPTAFAGSDQVIVRSPMTPFSIHLADAEVEDDGLTGLLDIQWSLASGPESGVSISDTTAEKPELTFYQTGTYTLNLYAWDGQFDAVSAVTVTVSEQSDLVPVDYDMTAGPDQEITLPECAHLTGAQITYADSGAPYPLDDLSLSWAKLKGPGDISFFDPNDPNCPAPSSLLNPSARFSRAGDYWLQFAVSDPNGSRFRTLYVRVNTGSRIATHVYGSYLIDEYGGVISAGANGHAQLGDGAPNWTDEYRHYFAPVVGGAQGGLLLTNIDSIAAGWIHCLALDHQGQVWSWGRENAGALGNGSMAFEGFQTAPVRVLTGMQNSPSGYLEDIVSVGAGCAHSLAVVSQGHLLAWGFNNGKQLGNRENRDVQIDPEQERAWVVNENGDIVNSEPVYVECPPDQIDICYSFDVFDVHDQFMALVTDFSGNSRDGYMDFQIGEIELTQGVGGGTALVVDRNGGKQTYVELTSTADPNYRGVLGSNPRTISFWVKGLEGSLPHGTVISWGEKEMPGALWDVKIFQDRIGVYVTSDNPNHRVESQLVSSDPNTWQHYVIRLPEAADTLQDIQIFGGAEGDSIERLPLACGTSELISLDTQYDEDLHPNPTIGISVDPNILPDPNSYGYLGVLEEFQLYPLELTEWEIQHIHAYPNSRKPIENIKRVSGGWYHSLGLEKLIPGSTECRGRVYLFGCYDDELLLPMGQFYAPIPMPGGEQGTDCLQDIVAVASGWKHCLALEQLDGDPNLPHRGRVYAWGSNGYGTPFEREDYDVFAPFICYGGRIGRNPNSVLFAAEPLLVYGPDLNSNGQHDLAEGYLEEIIAVAAGESHSLALDANGHVWSWGDNFFGQLGTNNHEWDYEYGPAIRDRNTNEEHRPHWLPEKVVGPDLNGDGRPDGYLGDNCPIVAIHAGAWHGLALDADGNVWAWGSPWACGIGSWEIPYAYTFNNFAYYPYPIKMTANRVVRISSQTGQAFEYDAIQPALDAADLNGVDEIIVYPGIYNESLHIDRSLILRSSDPDNPRIVETTIIDAAGLDDVIKINIFPGPEEQISSRVEVAGLTIRNGKNGIYYNNNNIPADVDCLGLEVALVGNHIRSNQQCGICAVYYEFNYLFPKVRFEIIGNEIIHNEGDGIRLSDQIVSEVANNGVHLNEWSGISIGDGSTVVKNNWVCENCFIYDFSDNTGISVPAGASQVTGNTVVNNRGTGIGSESYSHCLVWGNVDGNNLTRDPNFANLYNSMARVQSVIGSADREVATSEYDHFAMGDIIEYHGDGIPRVVTEIRDPDIPDGTKIIAFRPPLETTPRDIALVFNWGENTARQSQEILECADPLMLRVADPSGCQAGDVVQCNGTCSVIERVAGDTLCLEYPFAAGASAGDLIVNHSHGLESKNLTHDYHLTSRSTYCINQGGTYSPDEGETDIDGMPRVLDGFVDLGADEYCRYRPRAGSNQTVGLGQTVQPDACIFDDLEQVSYYAAPDGTAVCWQLIEQPADSACTIAPAEAGKVRPVFTPDALGEYVLRMSLEVVNPNEQQWVPAGEDYLCVTVVPWVHIATEDPLNLELEYDAASGLMKAAAALEGQVTGISPDDVDILWVLPENAPCGALEDASIAAQDDTVLTTLSTEYYAAASYEARLEAYHKKGRFLGADSIMVHVGLPDFQVNAGPDQALAWSNHPVSAALTGHVIGCPADQAAPWWRQIEGPAAVTFAPAVDGDPTQSGSYGPAVTFPAEGTYRFQFAAVWGDQVRVDEMRVVVGNPVILTAGLDLYAPLDEGIVQVTTHGALVYPQDGLTIQWYDGSTSLADATQPVTTFTFSAPGTYTYTLKAEDPADSRQWQDSVNIIVYDPDNIPQPGEVEILPGTYQPVAIQTYSNLGSAAVLPLSQAAILCAHPELVTCRWTCVSGSGPVIFDPNAPSGPDESLALRPTAIFTVPGVYTLRLEAFFNGTSLGSETTTVAVLEEGSSTDIMPPHLTWTALYQGADVDGRTLTIGGDIEISVEAADFGSLLEQVTLYLSTDAIPDPSERLTGVDAAGLPISQASFEHIIEMHQLQNQTTYYLIARAVDKANNTVTETRTFTVILPPTLDNPPYAAITNLPVQSQQIPQQDVCVNPPRIETGAFTLKGYAWHHAAQSAPNLIEYRFELYPAGVDALRDDNRIAFLTLTDPGKTRNLWGYYTGLVGDPNNPDPAARAPGVFGDLDLTAVENGRYLLVLSVRIPSGALWLTASDQVEFVLDTPLKLGQVKFTHEDVVVPVGGIPLRILRTYNSFERGRKGDFGHGWTCSFADMDLTLNEQRSNITDDFGNHYNVRTGSNYDRDVTLTLPDGRRVTFRFYLEYDQANYYDADMGGYIARYQSPPGVTARLETERLERMEATAGGTMFELTWAGQGTSSSGSGLVDPGMYDFSGYRLILEDGTTYHFTRRRPAAGASLANYQGESYAVNPCGATVYLDRITTPTGETIAFNPAETNNTVKIGQLGAGVEHIINDTVTKAITIEYDDQRPGLITAVCAPTEQGDPTLPTLKYVYDSYDNLIAVRKLVDRSAADPNDQYQTITYSYDDTQYDPADHFVTAITDPRGLQPIRYVYNDAGQLIATIDAKDNRIDIEHDLADRAEAVTDRAGNITIYTYDARGNVLSVTDPAGAVTTYTYDTECPFNPDRPLSVETPHQAVEGVVTETSLTRYAYTYYDDSLNDGDHYGQLKTQTVIDPNDNLTQTTYDPRGSVTAVTQGKNAVLDGTVWTYDEVTTTRTRCTGKNQPYLTGTTTGETNNLTWHTITLTFYDDTTGQVLQSVQVDMDNAVAVSQVFTTSPAVGDVKSHGQLSGLDWSGCTATACAYQRDPLVDPAYLTPNYQPDPTQVYRVTDPSGQMQYTEYNANGSPALSYHRWTDPAGSTDACTIVSVSDYDDAGRVVRTRQIVRDTVGAIAPSERTLSQTVYNALGQVDCTFDENGIMTVYDYDETGGVVQTATWQPVQQPQPADLTWELLTVSRTLYDAEGRPVVSVGPYDPTSPDLPVGTETVYDETGRVTETRRWPAVQIVLEDITSGGAVVGKKAVAWTTQGAAPAPDGELSRTRTGYDIAGRTWRTYTQNEDGIEVCTAEYRYDPSGRQIETVSMPDDPLQRTTTQTQYEGTRRTALTDARGSHTDFEYDALGRTVKTTLPAADYYYWDAQGQLQTAQAPVYRHSAYTALGQKAWDSAVTAQSDGAHIDSLLDLPHEKLRAKTFGYDSAGRMDNVQLPQLDTAENPQYEYFYDPAGSLIAIRDAECRLTVFQYDEHGRQTRRYMPFEHTLALTGYADIYALDLTSYDFHETQYDLSGRVTLEKDGKGQYTVYTYYDASSCFSGDPAPAYLGAPGQLMAKDYYIADPSVLANRRSSIEYTYDRLGRVRTQALIEYAADGQTPTRDDLWAYGYDVEGSLIRIDSPQGAVHYDYSPVTGRRLRTWTGPDRQTRRAVTEYAYDDLGRLETVTVLRRDGVELAAPEQTRYAYDENGNRHSVTLPNGVYTECAYDALNRLTNLTHYADENKTGEISAFAYGLYPDGSRAAVAESLDEPRNIVYEYDALNRLIREDSYTAAGHGYTAWYTYDLAGNRQSRTVEVTNSGGTHTLQTTYTYDPDTDRLLTETNTGPIAAIPDGDSQHIYAYANPGGKITYQLPGSDGRIGQFTAFCLGLPSVWNTVLFYTLLVLIPLAFFWTVLRKLAGSVFAHQTDDSLDAPDLKLWHRCMCVLLAYIFLVGPESFRILAQADIQFSDLSTLSWGRGDTIIEYGYDANGSLTSKTTTRGATVTETVAYEYNLQNRLAKVTTTKNPDTAPIVTETEYRYDPSGIRVEKKDTDSAGRIETHYLIDPQNHTGYAQVLEETADRYDASDVFIGADRLQYTLGDDVTGQTKSAWSGTDWTAAPTQYLLYDGHGSTRQLVRPDQSVVDTYSYDGYGVFLQETSTSLQSNPAVTPEQATSLLYAGEQYDFSIQQSCNRARWYNPLNGTFNRVDPYSGNLQDPQSLHKYLYCHANPVNMVDPTGMFGTMVGAVAAVSIQSLTYSIIGVAMGDALTGGRIGAGMASFFSAIMTPGLWVAAAKEIFSSFVDFITDVGALLKAVAIAILSQVFAFVNIAMTLWDGFKTAGMIGDIARSGLSAEEIGTVAAFLIATAVIVAVVSLAVGAAFKALGKGSGGIQENKIRGDQARDFVAARTGAIRTERTFTVTGGTRRMDVIPGGPIGMGIETKVGKVSLTKDVRRQLARDLKVIRSSKYPDINAVQWEFFESSVTGKSGPTGPLRDKLNQLGINYVVHNIAF